MARKALIKPADEASEAAKIAYYQQLALDAVQKQVGWYMVLLGIIVSIAGVVGYRDLLNRAEAAAISKLQASVNEEAKTRLIESVVSELKEPVEKKVNSKIDAVLANADGRYVKTDGAYYLEWASKKGQYAAATGGGIALSQVPEGWSLKDPARTK